MIVETMYKELDVYAAIGNTLTYGVRPRGEGCGNGTQAKAESSMRTATEMRREALAQQR